MRLYDLAAGMEDVINGGMVFDEQTGEVLFDSENLDALEMDFNAKLESCGCYIKNMDAEVTALANEIKALQSRKKAAEGKVSRMKDYVLRCMKMTSQKRLETPKVAISQRKSSRIEVTDDLLVPEDYKTIKEVVKVDKNAIKDAIRNGTNVSGCELVESVNLHIK